MPNPKGQVVSLWSGPRNRSTALMYSVAQRPEIEVVDEPLFGHYLALTGALRPSRKEVLESQSTNPQELLPILQAGPKVKFLKHMACHLRGWSPDVFADHLHVLLVRDPKSVVASYRKQIEFPTIEDLGIEWQRYWLDHCKKEGWPVVVLDSDRLAADPESGLKVLCHACGWEWNSAMLSWSPGPRKEDGVWAKYWYQGVHASTGWKIGSTQAECSLTTREQALVDVCRQHHHVLQEHCVN